VAVRSEDFVIFLSFWHNVAVWRTSRRTDGQTPRRWL